jgi:hypothetical protein
MKKLTSVKVLAIVNLFGFAGTIAMNGLANGLPLNGKTTGELSDQYPNLFVPAGFTFSIWGAIYLLLGAFVIFQSIRAFRADTHRSEFIEAIGPFFLISCMANMCWIFAWHYELVLLSVMLIFILLGSLLKIYFSLRIGTSTLSYSEKYFVHIPFSVYLGWITVAAIANITAWLVSVEWNRFGLSEQFWTAVMIATGTLISLLMLIRKKDIAFNLVFIWALFGIAMKRFSDPPEISRTLLWVSLVCMAVLIAGSGYQIAARRRQA